MIHTNKKPTVYSVIFILILITGITYSCNKKLLNLESTYTVKELLKSANCNTECGESADCEGSQVHLQGVLDANNINKENKQFFLQDASNTDYSIEVIVAETINDAIFDKLEGNGGKLFEITAIIKGYDAPMNFSCDRYFQLELIDVDNLIKK